MDGRKKFKYATCGNVFPIRQNKTLLLLTLKTIQKFQRENATAFAYIANKSTVEKIIRYLPAWGFPEGVEQ